MFLKPQDRQKRVFCTVQQLHHQYQNRLITRKLKVPVAQKGAPELHWCHNNSLFTVLLGSAVIIRPRH